MQNSLLWQVLFEPISELVPPAGGSEFGFHMCSEKPEGYEQNNDKFNDKPQNSRSFNNYLGSRYTSSSIVCYASSNTVSKFKMSIVQDFLNIYILNESKYIPLTFCYQGHMYYQIVFQRALENNEKTFISIAKYFVRHSMNRDNGYLNNSQVWQTSLPALLFLTVWTNWKNNVGLKLVNLKTMGRLSYQ